MKPKHWFLSTLLVLLLVPNGFAAGGPSEWAPKDALIYCGIVNCDETWSSLQNTMSYKLFKDPAVKDIADPMSKVFENVKKYVAKKMDLDSVKELEIAPHGGVALFAVGAPPKADEDAPQIHFTAVMEMGPDHEKSVALLKKIAKSLQKKGARKESKKIAGTEVLTFKIPESTADDEATPNETDRRDEDLETLLEDMDLDPATQIMVAQFIDNASFTKISYAIYEKKLILGDDADVVIGTVRRLSQKSEDRLANDRAVKTTRKYCARNANVEFLLNLPAIFEISKSVDPENAKEMVAVGLDAMGPVVMTIEFAPEENIETRMRGFVSIKANSGSLANILRMQNIKTTPPPSVPNDTCTYFGINLNPKLILEEILKITERIDPVAAAQMRASMQITHQDGSTLLIGKDFIDQLLGPATFVMTATAPYETEQMNFFVSLQHRSQDAIRRVLGAMPPGTVLSNEMRGATIYESPMVPVPGLAIGVTERALIPLGTKKSIEAFIRSEGQADRGLAQNPAFRAAAKHVPKESTVVFYQDQLAWLDAEIAIRKKGDISLDAPPMFGTPAGDMLRLMVLQNGYEKIAPENLDAIRKYQSASLLTVSTEPEGLRLTAVAVPSVQKGK